MSGVEADLIDDEGLREDYYLDELVTRAPSVDSLIRDVSCLHLFQGFTTYATPDDDVKPHQLSKSEGYFIVVFGGLPGDDFRRDTQAWRTVVTSSFL